MQTNSSVSSTQAQNAQPSDSSLSSLVARIVQARELGLVVVLVAIIAFVGVQQPRFLQLDNFGHILQSIAIIAIVAVGETLVILTRNVDLSVGSVVGFCAFASANLLKDHHDLNLIVVFLFGSAIGALLGAVNGLLVAYAGIPAIVVTLGTLNIYRGLDFAIAGGSEVSAFQVPTSFLNIAGATVFGIPLLVIIAGVIALIAGYLLRFSRQGRQLYAIGSNPDAAKVIGIQRSRLVFSAFLLTGALSGFAGVLWASYFATINSGAASGLELLVIAAVVVGGVNIFGGSGSMLGAMLGAIVLGTIQNALGILRVDQFWLQAIYGAAILIAVTLDALVTRQVQRLLIARRVRGS
jgi:rhamnose transport system permease protein